MPHLKTKALTPIVLQQLAQDFSTCRELAQVCGMDSNVMRRILADMQHAELIDCITYSCKSKPSTWFILEGGREYLKQICLAE